MRRLDLISHSNIGKGMDKNLRVQILEEVQTLIDLNKEKDLLEIAWDSCRSGSYEQQQYKEKIDKINSEIVKFIHGED